MSRQSDSKTMMISVIMPTISWGGTFPICIQKLLALLTAEINAGNPTECLVVLDGPMEPLPSWLFAPGLSVCATGQQAGPATARNLGAKKATGDVLMFVDADVELHAGSLAQIRQAFHDDPSLDAIFGSYDDSPAAPGVVSRFRNLLHHHTHHRHAGLASTFWAGCGAMRRDRFLSLGGFDTTYQRPSIEDVELGQRLWRQKGRIVLDPTIQGCHHKRWTLRSMVVTDICHRAIPWSHLLLTQRDTPASLNLSLRGRISGMLAPLVPLGLALAVLPGGWIAGTALAITALLMLTLLNHSFHRLHVRQCGWRDGIAGIGLHVLHLCCASGTFAVMACRQILGQPLAMPQALRERPGLRKGLVRFALLTLGLLALLAVSKGLLLGWSNAKDLKERWQEWQLFSEGHYFPMRGLYGAEAPMELRTSPYPLWSVPMFALFFHPLGLHQGILSIQLLSLVSLAFIAWIGYHHLLPYGKSAGLFGALGPIAISGNANALAIAQFSILCVGLLFLQWKYLIRQQPKAAGIAWSLAMIKPQISILHLTPFVFQRRQRRGFWTGLLILSLLSFIAVYHTRINVGFYGQRFLRLLFKVQDDSGWNLSLQLSQTKGVAWLIVAAGIIIMLMALKHSRRLASWRGWRLTRVSAEGWMVQAGALSLAGFLGFYHRSTDNIMLAPALLAMADMSWRQRRLGITALTLLFGSILWIPGRLFLIFTPLQQIQYATCGLCLAVLIIRCWSFRESQVTSDQGPDLPM
ncbi:MAG: glycosyltransferase [Cyanobacteriota bacterium]|nr:glycosyltransferase [Cyanobacteriota bacterium]